jgi:hypothetical protein
VTARRTPQSSGVGESLVAWIDSQVIGGLLDGLSLIPAPVLPGVPGAPLQPPGVGTLWQIDYFEYDPRNADLCLSYYPLTGSETVFIARPPSGSPVLISGSEWNYSSDNKSVVELLSGNVQAGDIVVVQYAHNATPGDGTCVAPTICDPVAVSSPPGAYAPIPARLPPRMFSMNSQVNYVYGGGATVVGSSNYPLYDYELEPTRYVTIPDGGTISNITTYQEDWIDPSVPPPSYARIRARTRGSGTMSVTVTTADGLTTDIVDIVVSGASWSHSYEPLTLGTGADWMVEDTSLSLAVTGGTVDCSELTLEGVFPVGSAYATDWIQPSQNTGMYDRGSRRSWSGSEEILMSESPSADSFDGILGGSPAYTVNASGNYPAYISRSLGISGSGDSRYAFNYEQYHVTLHYFLTSDLYLGDYDFWTDPVTEPHISNYAGYQWEGFDYPGRESDDMYWIDFYSNTYEPYTPDLLNQQYWGAPITEQTGLTYSVVGTHATVSSIRTPAQHEWDGNTAPGWGFSRPPSIVQHPTDNRYVPETPTPGPTLGPVLAAGQTYTDVTFPLTSASFSDGNATGAAVVFGLASSYANSEVHPTPVDPVSFSGWQVSYAVNTSWFGAIRMYADFTPPRVRYLYPADWTPGEC